MASLTFIGRDINHSPSPCGKGLGVGVVPLGERSPGFTTPIPLPSPQGGREEHKQIPSSEPA
jgi:hypothetical protein